MSLFDYGSKFSNAVGSAMARIGNKAPVDDPEMGGVVQKSTVIDPYQLHIAQKQAGMGTDKYLAHIQDKQNQYAEPMPSTGTSTGGAVVAEPPYIAALRRAYEGRRENAQSEAERERLAAEERLKGRLAGAGISNESGLYQKALLQSDTQSQKNLAARLGALDIEQADTESGRAFQMDLANMQNAFAEGRIRLQDMLDDQDAADKVVADSWFAKGKAGEVIDPATLESLKTSNPTAYYSYMNGKSGKSIEENTQDIAARTQYRNALILKLDPASPDYVKILNEIFGYFSNPEAPLGGFESNTPPPPKENIGDKITIPGRGIISF